MKFNQTETQGGHPLLHLTELGGQYAGVIMVNGSPFGLTWDSTGFCLTDYTPEEYDLKPLMEVITAYAVFNSRTKAIDLCHSIERARSIAEHEGGEVVTLTGEAYA